YLVFIVLIAFVLVGCQNDDNKDDNTETNLNTGEDNASETSNDDVNHPVVKMIMKGGVEVALEVMPAIAHSTVNIFIWLVEDGFYDGLIFHRVMPGFMAQGGDPDGVGTGGPGYSIAGEFESNDFDNNLSHERNVISMARSQHPDSAGSQF